MDGLLRRSILLSVLVLLAVSAAGCAAIAGIFKAGLWVGVILAVVVIGGAVMVFNMLR